MSIADCDRYSVKHQRQKKVEEERGQMARRNENVGSLMPPSWLSLISNKKGKCEMYKEKVVRWVWMKKNLKVEEDIVWVSFRNRNQVSQDEMRGWEEWGRGWSQPLSAQLKQGVGVLDFIVHRTNWRGECLWRFLEITCKIRHCVDTARNLGWRDLGLLWQKEMSVSERSFLINFLTLLWTLVTGTRCFWLYCWAIDFHCFIKSLS